MRREALRELARAKYRETKERKTPKLLRGSADFGVPKCSECGVTATGVKVVADSTIPYLALSWLLSHAKGCSFLIEACKQIHFDGEGNQVKCPHPRGGTK